MFASHNPLSVSEAALKLNVHPSRVRVMAADQRLDAEKIGGRWLIDGASVDRRLSEDPSVGRPYSAANAWALLNVASGHPVHWLDPSSLSRLRANLRHRGLRNIAPRLRSRAEPKRLRVHPSALGRLSHEPYLVRAGVSAAEHVGIDVQPSEEHEAYVRRAHYEGLVRKYHMEPSDRPNVLLRILRDSDPFPWQGSVAAEVAAIDLLESDEPRSRRAALRFIDHFDEIRGS